ncbi:MAG: hypothetical protein ACRDOL_25605, partial [Streptosporangiaceae bacterium]
MTGVELDPVTAAIAAALYPDADIMTGSFADTRLPAGSFDAAIGNVPFSEVKLHDPVHNPGRRLSTHDHFIVKTLAAVRPGGLVAVLTSRYTMDARNPQARRQIAEAADLVAAIRLPSGAHRRAAGTDVVTDLLILRRREPFLAPASSPAWEQSLPAGLPGGEVHVNEYWAANPGMVLGLMRAGTGMYGTSELEVTGTGQTAADLRAALEEAVTSGRNRALVMTGPAADVPAAQPAAAGPELLPQLMPGMLLAHRDGTFARVTAVEDDGRFYAGPYRPPKTQAPELRRLIRLRDTALALLRAEQGTLDDTTEIDRLRARLNRDYDAYARLYGPAKRFKWGKPRPKPKRRQDDADDDAAQDDQDEVETAPRLRPGQGGFRTDPFYPVVYALEGRYDPATGTAAKADIFSQRVIVPDPPLLGADTAEEALAICISAHGQVRLDEIARLLGVPGEQQARDELGTLVFDDPAGGDPVWAPLYLSGNVRDKLAAAQAAAETDPRFAPNVTALREIIPRDRGPAEIEAQLGVGWIDARYVQQFTRELLGEDPDGTASTTIIYNPKAAIWQVDGGARRTVAATSTWGTDRLSAQELIERLLTGTAENIRLTYKVKDHSVYDAAATEAAKQKARDIADRFAAWVWEDPGRAGDLCQAYNAAWNAQVPVNFDKVQLILPGLSKTLALHPHQPAAIARVIYQGSAGLVHDTGAGKTLEAIIGVHERRRLGLSHKPCFVVQRHKLSDFRDEYLRAYPGAHLLVADTPDLEGDKRREFVARCATGNFDAIIMSREAFTRIPVSARLQARFIRAELEALREVLDDAKREGKTRGGRRDLTTKKIEKLLDAAEERLKYHVDRIGHDQGLTYEDTGIDYLVIDEAQGYRRGPLTSALPGESARGSDRARDLLIKVTHHLDVHGESRICLASARPWVNRISELFVWLRYLGHDLGPYDLWCRTFARFKPGYEMTPTGHFKVRVRLREIINAPDLYLYLRDRSDFKLHGHGLTLKLPRLRGGRPQITAVTATAAHRRHSVHLQNRIQNLPKGPPEKGQDCYLSVQNDAIKAALDLRLVGRQTEEPQKADVVAGLLHDLWLAHRDDVYPRPDGTPDPVTGSLILVFASLGVPGEPGKWNFYHEVRGQMTALGVPAAKIRFIHEARDMAEREELFRACRAGEVAFLFGSTGKLGEGTNVQDRAAGLVQVTAPWNWDEPDQEMGRVIRQGNLNDEVFCIRVVTSPSCDALKWQRAKDKKDAFYQLLTGEIDGRTIRVPDDDLTPSEMVAASSGDPRHLERAQLEANIARLDMLRRDWARNQSMLTYRARDAREFCAEGQKEISRVGAAIARRVDTRGDAFAMTIDGHRHTRRADAAAALTAAITPRFDRTYAAAEGRRSGTWEIGTLGGFTVTLRINLDWYLGAPIRLWLDGIPDTGDPIGAGVDDLSGKPLAGLITRLENRIAGLEKIRADLTGQIDYRRAEAEAAEAETGGQFPRDQELTDLRGRLDALEKDLFAEARAAGQHAADQPEAAEAAGPAATGPDPPGQDSQNAGTAACPTGTPAPASPPGATSGSPAPDDGIPPGRLDELAAAHGLAVTVRADGRRTITHPRDPGRPAAAEQDEPGGRLLNHDGRLLTPEAAAAYLAEYAADPGAEPDTLYARTTTRLHGPGQAAAAAAGERAWRRGSSHTATSDAALRARETGTTHFVYTDAGACISAAQPPPDAAYYSVTADDQWTRHLHGTATATGRPTAGQLSLINGEPARTPAGDPASQAAAGPAEDAPAGRHDPGVPDGSDQDHAWTTAHRFAGDIAAMLQAALADQMLAQTAAANSGENFAQVFTDWADRHVTASLRDGHPQLPPFTLAYFDDLSFAADLRATLARQVYLAHGGTAPAGGTHDRASAAAARAWRQAIQAGQARQCGCGTVSGCRHCQLPARQDTLTRAAAIDIHLARAGVPHTSRTITWDARAGTYALSLTHADGTPLRLPVPDPAGARPGAAPADVASSLLSLLPPPPAADTRPAGSPDQPGDRLAAFSDLAARHGLHAMPGEFGGEILISDGQQPGRFALCQERPGAPVLNSRGRLIPLSRADAYLAAYAASPGTDPDQLYALAAGPSHPARDEHVFPAAQALAAQEHAAGRAREAGTPCYIYGDGMALVATMTEPAGRAHYTVTPAGQWTAEGQAAPLAGHPPGRAAFSSLLPGPPAPPPAQP